MTISAEAPASVLIAEGEVEMAELYASWLTEQHDVRVAHDCLAAHEELDGNIDVVLLDRLLPDGDGREVLEHIRDAGYDCRVALVSSVQPDLDIVDMGFDDYLSKPTTRAAVRSAVDRLLAHSVYRSSMTDLYTLLRKKALLEAKLTRSELAASDEFAALEARYDELVDEVTELAAMFSQQQFSTEMARIESGDETG